MAPVSIYSWWGNRNELSDERELRRTETCWGNWKTFAMNWYQLKQVETRLSWYETFYNISYITGASLKASGWLWGKLGQIETNRVEFEAFEWCCDDLMTIRVNTGHEYSQMGRLLWVRHICYKLVTFGDISWWLHDDLRHLSWFVTSEGELETFETSWDEVALDLRWSRGIWDKFTKFKGRL